MKLERLWGEKPLKQSYDAVMIGGGIHGLATAYFLAKDHGMKNIAVIEGRYVGFGGSGRNTAIVRANQRSQENVRFYDEGLKLWPHLMDELDFNMMFDNCGNLNTAHSEAAVSAARLAVTTAQFCGVHSELLDRKQCAEMVPQLNMSWDITYPIFGGMYHPPGGILRHDGVAWGLAKGASKHGASIHQLTTVKDILVEDGKIAGVETDKGTIRAPKVLICAGGYGNYLAQLLGIKLPIHPLTIQAMVTQPLKPLFDHVVSSGAYHVYCNQTLKGEIATGAHMDPWPNYTTNTTAHYLKHQAEALTEILPCLKGVKFMRHWAGLADMTPDMCAILEGELPVPGLFLDVGWGYFGFKSGPITGKYMAQYMATDKRPEIIEAFSLHRFENFTMTGEIAGAYTYGPWN